MNYIVLLMLRTPQTEVIIGDNLGWNQTKMLTS